MNKSLLSFSSVSGIERSLSLVVGKVNLVGGAGSRKGGPFGNSILFTAPWVCSVTLVHRDLSGSFLYFTVCIFSYFITSLAMDHRLMGITFFAGTNHVVKNVFCACLLWWLPPFRRACCRELSWLMLPRATPLHPSQPDHAAND